MANIDLDLFEYSSDALAQAAYVTNDLGSVPTAAYATGSNNLVSHFDGADAATTYSDPVKGAYTFAGTAQLDTAQYKFSTASLLLDGNSDYVTTPDHADWNFGTGDFTIDLWFRAASIPAGYGVYTLLSQVKTTTAVDRFLINFQAMDGAATRIDVNAYENSVNTFSSQATAGSLLLANTWYHIAIVRSGNYLLTFLDGVLLATNAWSGTMPDIAGVITIGCRDQYFDQYTNGWIDEVRILKGTAVWTSNFNAGSLLQSYSEATIKTQGSYALKSVAALGALNKTLTKTFSSPLDLTGKQKIKFDMRSTRTGANVKLGLHNVGNLVSNADINDEDMADITEWTDSDGGTGASTQVTFDSKTCMKLDSGSVGGANYGYRTQDIGTFGSRTVITMSTYCDAIGVWSDGDGFEFVTNNSTYRMYACFSSDGLYIVNSSDVRIEVGIDLVVQDTWQEWTFDINWSAGTVDIYLNKVLQATGMSLCSGANANGFTYFFQPGVTTANRVSYVDWFKAGSAFVRLPSTTELTPTITTAGTYQTVTWDISAVSNVDKNAIDKLILTPIETSASNTFYLDNMYALIGFIQQIIWI